ncbi:NTP transferase domain-containing protein [Sphingomonas sp. ID0503]|uniref:NTP transferase domain-containing protein n=1 Tax=Sphingomonas sp. ID0503 TaxID=3399691 RepID=UPI003AFB3C37
MTHTAILLAGRRPGLDPLAASEGLALKALIPVGGQPMVAQVATTLLDSGAVSAVRVLTQDVAEIARVLPDDPRVTVHKSGGGIASSVAAIAGSQIAPWPLFVTTADHPLLTPKTVRSFIVRSQGTDVAVGVVERETVLGRFPANKRTWLKFKGGWWTGANLFALDGPAALPLIRLWSEVEQDRKKGWKLIARFGPWLLIRALTRTITLPAAVATAGRSIGVRVAAIALDDPLAAVDVDKHSDLMLAREVLGR